MMAAIRAAEHGAKVILFEKMPRVGRKLGITGKGRCNLTNTADIAKIVKNIPGNGKFLFSALKNFSSVDTVNFFDCAIKSCVKFVLLTAIEILSGNAVTCVTVLIMQALSFWLPSEIELKTKSPY